MTNGDELRARAEKLGIPPVSLEKAKEGIAKAKKTKADAALAGIMLRQGRLSPEARAWLEQEYPQK